MWRFRSCFGVLLALFITLTLSLSVSSADSSAISDLSGTVSAPVTSWTTICQNSSCDGYSFLYLDFSNIIADPTQSNSADLLLETRVQFKLSNNQTRTSSYYCHYSFDSSCLIDLNTLSFSSLPYIQFAPYYGGATASGSFTWTLSDSNPLASCPEIEPCPVIPEYPYEDELTNLKNSILLVGSVPIVLYFFYCIYRMIIRSTT